ncbi:MAG: polysaccharide deacetylase family protein [Clostridiales bacterium]|jgi:peptidoglycan-N-acetylmuramic acid deacetylase|nr:polysaccharide deacetylase family protein [Clostridiales bacterium]
MRAWFQILLCAALLFLCVSCEISQESPAPAVVIAGTPGIGDGNEYIRDTDFEPGTINPTPTEGTPTPSATETPTEGITEETSEETSEETTEENNPETEPEATGDATGAADTIQPFEPEEPSGETEFASGNTLPATVQDPYPSGYQTVPGLENLSNEKMGWYYNRNSEHQPPTAQRVFDIRDYGGYYLGDIENKIVYLTFDEGYENGFTGPILDTLRDKNVPAAFFLTQTYIRDNPALCMRMAAEGHVAANHSVTHPSMPDKTDEDIRYELTETARYYQEVTGYRMAPFFRPPAGEYSARTMALTQANGYKTVFWSFAYEDWLVDKQPGKDEAYNRVMDNLHNGAIILLHAVSESNAQALPDIIDSIRAQGYAFGTLYELP